MDNKEFNAIKEIACHKLKQLSSDLTYHNLEHTVDVMNQTERIAREEGVSDADVWLLKIAALYHDTGFLKVYRKHEEISCALFLEDAVNFDFTRREVQIIMGLILATKLPQEPNNHLEQIICDADLDYLGREDFFAIGDELRKEFLAYGIVESDSAWEQLQIDFLKSHQYHTKTSQREKEGAKRLHLRQLY